MKNRTAARRTAFYAALIAVAAIDAALTGDTRAGFLMVAIAVLGAFDVALRA